MSTDKYFTARWSRFELYTTRQLHERWVAARSEKRFSDPLLETDRYDAVHDVWTVQSTDELARLVGALQFRNQRRSLWFRGENKFFETLLPRRQRGPRDEDTLRRGLEWIDKIIHKDALLRDRQQLARIAVLQHYGVPTSFVDVTSAFEIALPFAFIKPTAGRRDPHLRILATPRIKDSINFAYEPGICFVDLAAELPSYCLRPHVQRAGFVASLSGVDYDLTLQTQKSYAEMREWTDLKGICIAHIRLHGRASTFGVGKHSLSRLKPKASRRCKHCSKSGDDLSGDLLWHVMKCLAQNEPALIVDFPE